MNNLTINSFETATNNHVNRYLVLADSALIMAQRLSEWCGNAPILEQDIAVSNIALDYIGQARNWYQFIANTLNKQENTQEFTEDTLAYLRDVTDYKNLLLTELPNNNWADTILRIFLFSNFQSCLLHQLQKSNDATVAAIAEKSLKETSYHVEWSSDWVIRLGDGTDESKQKMEEAILMVWNYVGEFFEPTLHSWLATNEIIIEQQWQQKTQMVFEEATLVVPQNKWMHSGGIYGNHTEHLGFILAEMQFLQRAYPNSKW
jgi:ring-1,2-phenylacetyl-CoA epoxidase subunit PaaC